RAARRAPRRGARLPHGRDRPQHVHLPEPVPHRRPGRHPPRLLAHGARRHGGPRLGARAGRGGAGAARQPPRGLSALSRPRRLRHPGRRRGAGGLPGGIRGAGRRVVRRVARHAAGRPALVHRRAAPARLLARVARPHPGAAARRPPRGPQAADVARFGARIGRGTMTANGSAERPASAAISREEVEDFLYAEAALLDAWQLDEWLTLFTDDARYVVPSTDLPNADPSTTLSLIDDDMVRLRGRVARLNSRHAYREFPWSRTRRFISNVRITAADGD